VTSKQQSVVKKPNPDTIIVLPNAHVPIVHNPKFEFAPYDNYNNGSMASAPKSQGDGTISQNVGKMCERYMKASNQLDKSKMSQVQLREPPEKVVLYL
jgi:hypothetical protein